MQNSLWCKKTELKVFKKLNKDIKTQVLVIGGGICGILCAYYLRRAGIDCILVEKDRIAQGVTNKTTAKITSLHGLIYSYITEKFGKEKAIKYLSANENALNEYKKLCSSFDCDFQVLNAYTFSENNRKSIEKEVAAINSLGSNAIFTNKTDLPFDTVGAVCMENQAQFNPLKFISHIIKELNIYENTPVHDITKNYAVCGGFKIYADSFIVATHFPFINTHGSYFLKLYQSRSYVLALKNAQKVNGMYVQDTDNGLSLRNAEDLLLIGGFGGRTGKNCGNWKALNEFKEKHYPKSKVLYKWATQDCMSLDKIPYIGHYSKMTPNIFVASGFNKWGMTSSMVAAKLLCDMIQGIKNDYEDLFSPSRSILKSQLAVNCFEAACNFVSPTKKRCSHLGCALKWNKSEHTWDCPCHGSRFTDEGEVINNPAKKPLA